MALNFNCGQYEEAFWPKRLQNWEKPKHFRRHPITQEGYTEIVATSRGHLLPSMPRSSRSPWGTFVGTWDLPKKLPGNKQFDPMARSADAHFRQLSAKKEAEEVIYGRNKDRRTNAGQPTQSMSYQQDATNYNNNGTVRSGAANPLVKGTPNRGTSPKAYSPQANMSNTAHCGDNIATDTIPAELDCARSPVLAPSPPTVPDRITPVRASPAHHLSFSPKYCSPLPNISGGSRAANSPALAKSPKAESPVQKIPTPPVYDEHQEMDAPLV